MVVNGEDGTVLWDSYAIPNALISTGDTKRGPKSTPPPVLRKTSPTIEVARNLLIFGTRKPFVSVDQNMTP